MIDPQPTQIFCAARNGHCGLIPQTLGGMVDLGFLDLQVTDLGISYVPTQRMAEFFGLDQLGIGVVDGTFEFVDQVDTYGDCVP